jgi:hypothetical protein
MYEHVCAYMLTYNNRDPFNADVLNLNPHTQYSTGTHLKKTPPNSHLLAPTSRMQPNLLQAGIERALFNTNAGSVSTDVVSKEKLVTPDAVKPGSATSMV